MREEELAYIEVYNTDKRNEELSPADIKNRVRDYKTTFRALNEATNASPEQVEKDEFKFSMLDNELLHQSDENHRAGHLQIQTGTACRDV